MYANKDAELQGQSIDYGFKLIQSTFMLSHQTWLQLQEQLATSLFHIPSFISSLPFSIEQRFGLELDLLDLQ